MKESIQKKLTRQEENQLFERTEVLYQFEEVLDDVEFGELSDKEEYKYYYSNSEFETVWSHKKIFTFTNDKKEYEKARNEYYSLYDGYGEEAQPPLEYYKIEREVV